MLPDRSFYGSFKMPYRFIDVTDQIGSAADMERYEWLKGHDYFDIPPRADAPATGN